MRTGNDAVVTTITSAWNTTGSHMQRRPSLFHMTFYWGYNCEVLFSGWPDSSRGMYALALIFVFALAVMVEWLARCTDKAVKLEADKVATCAFRTGMYAVRSGVHYLVVLSVVSFNGGVFLAALFGHTFGFLIFRGRTFRKTGQAGA